MLTEAHLDGRSSSVTEGSRHWQLTPSPLNPIMPSVPLSGHRSPCGSRDVRKDGLPWGQKERVDYIKL